MSYQVRKIRSPPTGTGTACLVTSDTSRSLPMVEYHSLAPSLPLSALTCLAFGSGILTPVALDAPTAAGWSLTVAVRAALHDLGLHEAEDSLVVDVHRRRLGADAPLATEPGAAGHDGPEAAARVAGRRARVVVLVGEPEVVAELVAEDADVAVLWVDRVVVGPDALGLRALPAGAGDHHAGAVAGAAAVVLVDAPRVRPDGVRALRSAAGRLVAAGVDEDQMVEVTVRLVEVVAGDAPRVLLVVLLHISEPTRLGMISYAVFCLKKKK